MKVLIVKTSSMGDVIHSFPALTDALKAKPDLVVDWCVEAAFADLVRLHPGVRNVHTVAVRNWRKSIFSSDTRAAIGRYLHNVRVEKYDLVIDAQGLMKSALLARMPGAATAGLDFSSVREPVAALFYSARYKVDSDRHAIDRTRILFGRVLGYAPDLSQLDYGLKSVKPPAGRNRSVFLLHGTTWSSKRWHTAGWIELAAGLVARGLVPAVTFSNEAEREVAEQIYSAVAGTRMIAKTTLGQIAGIMAGSAAVVGTDTGLTHLACALDLPTLQIALSTAADLTGPRGDHVAVQSANIDCAPCRRRDCPLVPTGAIQPCAPTVSAEQILTRLDLMI